MFWLKKIYWRWKIRNLFDPKCAFCGRRTLMVAGGFQKFDFVQSLPTGGEKNENHYNYHQVCLDQVKQCPGQYSKKKLRLAWIISKRLKQYTDFYKGGRCGRST